jgi:hypothetical protein
LRNGCGCASVPAFEMGSGRAAAGFAALLVATALLGGCGGSNKPRAAATAATSPSGQSQTGPTPFIAPTPTPQDQPSPKFTFEPSPGPSLASGERPPNGGPAPASAPRMNDQLKCRIAVSNGTPGSGGFVVFPGGQFEPDNGSNVTTPGGGSFGMTYVRSAQKWAPVGRSWVAGDGSRYAYPDFQNGGVHVESLSGGAELILGGSQRWNLVDVEADAVYAAPGGGGGIGGGAPAAGLWKLPMDGSAPEQVIDHGSWTTIIGGAAWGTALANPPPGAPNPLVKHPLAGGAETTYRSVGDNFSILGVDGDGRPIVETQSQVYGSSFVALSMLLSNDRLDTFWSAYQMYPSAPVIADQWGIWFTLNSSPPGLIRWTYSGPHTAAGIGGQLGSSCF